MRPKGWMFLFVASSILICAVTVYAGNVQMTTYYPAPTGYYDNIKVNKGLVIPCYKEAPSSPAAGAIWIIDPSCQ